MKKETVIPAIAKILEDKSLRIVILSHVNPDGDAIGSSMGLYHYLKALGFSNLTVISPNAFPEFLQWIPGSDRILLANQQSRESGNKLKAADLIFCLDFNDMARTEDMAVRLDKAPGTKILIDHHPDPQPGFDYVISETSASSTAEMVYDFIDAMGDKKFISNPLAQCLYAGIITDTGSLSYACNNPRTYQIIAHLIELGVDGEQIHRLIYDTYSESRMRLLGYCLSERLAVLKQHQTAYISLSQKDLLKFNYRDGDTEGVVNYGLSMKGIVLAAIFIERKETIKVSFRSEGSADVNILARNYFNGGGHKNAAGGNFKGTLEEATAFFENLLTDISRDNFSGLQQVEDNP